MGSPERRVERRPLLGPEPDPAGRRHWHVYGRHHLLLHLHTEKFVVIDDVIIGLYLPPGPPARSWKHRLI